MIECEYCMDGIWHGECIARCTTCMKAYSHVGCHRRFIHNYEQSMPCGTCGNSTFMTDSYYSIGDLCIRMVNTFYRM